MDANNFAYWLNGFAELSGDNPPTKAQWKSIKEHLALVFEKVTPEVGIVKKGKDHQITPQVPIDWPTITREPQRPLTTRCIAGIRVDKTLSTRSAAFLNEGN